MLKFFKKSIRLQFLFIIMVTLIIAFIGLSAIFSFQSVVKSSYVEDREVLSTKRDLIHDMEESYNKLVLHVRGYVAFHNEDELRLAELYVKNLKEDLYEFEQLNLNEKEYNIVSQFEIFLNTYWEQWLPEAKPIVEAGNYEGLKAFSSTNSTTTLVNDLIQNLEQISEQLNSELKQINQEFLDWLNLISLSLVLYLIVIFLVLSIAARRLTLTIGNPLHELSEAASLIAKGENTQISVLKRADELGTLSQSFADMVEKIKDRESNLSTQNERLIQQREQLELYVNDLKNLNLALNESSIVAITDAKGKFLSVNQKFCDISKFSEKELIGEHYLRLSVPDQKDTITDIDTQMEDGRIWSGELKNQRKDGSIYWVYATIVPYFDENRRIQQFVSIQQEITAIKEHQVQLEASIHEHEKTKETLQRFNQLNHALSTTYKKQELVEEVLDHIASIYKIDKGILFLHQSDEYSGIGISKNEEHEFKRSFQIVTNRLQSNPITYTTERKTEKEATGYHTNTTSYDLHAPITNSAEELMAVLIITRIDHPFDEKEILEIDGILKRIALSLERIEFFEQTENNRQLNQDIIDNINEGIQFVNQEGCLIHYNQKWLDFFAIGHVPDSISLYQYETWSACSLEHVHEKEKLEKFMKEAIFEEDNQEVTYQFEVENSHSRVLVVYAEAVYHAGQRMGTLFVYRDITAEYEVDQMKSNLVSTVSHELRTPLASVLGYTELMINKELKPERQERYLKTIHKEAQRLTSLINDFLDLQRMEAGRQEYVMKKVDMVQLASDVVNSFEAKRKSHPITIKNPSQSAFVMADARSMTQLYNNLIGNAIKFSPDGGDIVISFNTSDDQLFIHISDNGIGIPDHEINRLFTKFHRIDHSDQRKIGGTGLGLAICKEIVDAHNGKITVRSEVEIGSVFTIILPLTQPESQVETEQDNTLPEVILVEDDRSLSRLLEDELQDTGFCVRTFASGKKVQEKMEQLAPDAFVIDLMLGDGPNGWEVIHSIKQYEHLVNVPIFISSALEEKEKGQQLGVTDYLTKPYPPNKISTVILQTLLQYKKEGQILFVDEEK
ncbi:ATP-binding protein [Radiobacillus kanasensis]|uniref:ATP-binding protein n=1 Tax=Radiobacillus kanasensis TaxID=2844358 RepID=UPI001E466BAF|nr:ATP-binding protein [Radiobacillus kanasensis]UFU00544.1 ATP-binding protein [Radiobacillus kanasensis]